jgi:hypothetical protein
MLHKLTFYCSVAITYILTIGTIGVLLQPSHSFGTFTQSNDTAAAISSGPIHKPTKSIRGKPVRITVPGSGIDLPVDEGNYDKSSDPPPTGSVAKVYTDNGHEFTYELQKVANLKPADTWILSGTHGGAPRLVVQTCTGALSEWRTMFTFVFKEVK